MKRRGLKPGYVAWTPEQEALVRAMYATVPTVAELVALLGHPEHSIRNRAKRLGVRRLIRTPVDQLGKLGENTLRALELAARPGGVGSADMADATPDRASTFLCKLVRRGKLYRSRAGGKAQYFTTREAAERYSAPILVVHSKAKPKVKQRAGWGPDDPIHYPMDEHGNKLYRETKAPPPPAMVFRTNTYPPR
jgi:hypothetical protein